MPHCPPGQVNAGAALWCFTPCGPDGSCKEGTCTESQGARLCLPPSSVSGPSVAARPSSPPVATAPFAAAELTALARPVIDAAARAADACHLVAIDPGTWFAYISYDVCTWKDADVAAYADKARELAAYAGGHDLPAPARTVADHARLFGEWLASAHRAKNGRGTARLFQDLALAWNAYAPDQKVDPDPPGIVKQYTEDFGEPRVNLIWRTPAYGQPGMTPFKAHQALPRPLKWRNGAQGPFLGD
jgi:hypothetical protein